jgi:hypothetical protein
MPGAARRSILFGLCLLLGQGCLYGAVLAAGPVVGFTPARGLSVGWAGSMGGFVNGLSGSVAVGQAYRTAAVPPPRDDLEDDWRENRAPEHWREYHHKPGKTPEIVTFLSFRPAFAYASPDDWSGLTGGLDLGVAWSQLDRHPGLAAGAFGGTFVMPPRSVGLTPACGLFLGFRYLYGEWEVYATLQPTLLFYGPLPAISTYQ